MKTLVDQADRALPAEILARLPRAEEAATRNLKQVSAALRPEQARFDVRLTALLESDDSKKRKLRGPLGLADKIAAAVAPHAVCKKGCTHCCHIPVAMTQTEANLIAEQIGRIAQPVPPSDAQVSGREYGYHVPCTFLKDGNCSIYERRPFACRVHLNLDDDKLLCRLLPGIPVPVPYFNSTHLRRAYVEICDSEALADIRQFSRSGLNYRRGRCANFVAATSVALLQCWLRISSRQGLLTMTRSELVTRIASHFRQLAAEDVEASVLAILSALTNSLVEGKRVEVRGFGSFTTSYRPPRTGRNPLTGESVAIPAKFVPRFKAGVELRDREAASAKHVKLSADDLRETGADAQLRPLA